MQCCFVLEAVYLKLKEGISRSAYYEEVTQ